MRIALATCRKLPEPDADAALLTKAFKGDWLAWDDPKADFGAYDAVVIRSTWNYIHHHAAFLKWAKAVSRTTTLLNPYDVIRWNTDKSYLKKLPVRTVPTSFGSSIPKAWTDVVVKPRVGAGSFLTKRLSRAKALAFLKVHRRRKMMVQPYLASVESRGERCLVWIAGKFTNAVRKSPRFSAGHESVRRVPIAADERAFGEKALAPWAKRLLYARVDIARDERGRPILMELELVEPSLFLKQNPAAARRLAIACRKAPNKLL